MRVYRHISRGAPYRIELGLLLVVLVYAGFAGWQGEHAAAAAETRAHDTDTGRHLSENQKARLIRTLKPIGTTIPAIRVWSGYPSEHVQYCMELMDVFHTAAIRIVNERVGERYWPHLTQSLPTEDRGLIIGVYNKDRPPEKAITFARALRKAGFAPSFARDSSLEEHSQRFSFGVLGRHATSTSQASISRP